MHDGIAQHVLQRRNHPLQHLPIEFRGGALHRKLRPFAGIVRRLPHQSRQALHVALEGHHARAHQTVLQLGDDPRLLRQQALRLARQSLQQSLNTGDVARSLGKRARELLQRGVAVQFEWIEIIPPRFDTLVPVQYLRFGLHLQAAQLLLQARDGSRQLGQIEINRIDLLIQAGAKDADLAGIVEHRVEQFGIHARHFHPLHGGRLAARQYRRAAQFQA